MNEEFVLIEQHANEEGLKAIANLAPEASTLVRMAVYEQKRREAFIEGLKKANKKSAIKPTSNTRRIKLN